jgi:hypothetical protein
VKHIDLQDILFLDSVVMKYLYAVFFALVFSGFVLPTAVAQTTMEKEIWKIDDNRQNETAQEAPIEVSSKDGSIYIRTPRKVQVVVYTILGQIVTDRTINPGLSELKIGVRGIYLVKIEGQTQKIAL